MNKTLPTPILIISSLLFFATHSIFSHSDSLDFEDKDGDGYGIQINGGGLDVTNFRNTSDPDDYDPSIHPAAEDISVDGVDQNGDGIDGPALDQYGGFRGEVPGFNRSQSEITGFFRTQKIGNRWWFITPEGNPFFMNTGAGRLAANEVKIQTFVQSYQAHGFNTVGQFDVNHWQEDTSTVDGNRFHLHWSDFPENMPFYVTLYNFFTEEGTRNPRDFFSNEWINDVTEYYTEMISRFSDMPRVIGYAYSVEPKWFTGHAKTSHLFDDYMAFAADAPGKVALVDFLTRRYNNDIDQFNQDWDTNLVAFNELYSLAAVGPKPIIRSPQGLHNEIDFSVYINGFIRGLIQGLWSRKAFLSEEQLKVKTDFMVFLAQHHYKTLHDLIRELAPNQLILGDHQLSISGTKGLVEVVSKYSDVYSLNSYPLNFWSQAFMQTTNFLAAGGHTDDLMSTGFGTDVVSDVMALIGDKPLIIEFGIAGDEGPHNGSQPGAFAVVPKQRDRAEFAEKTYDLFLQTDQVIGIQYYAFGDQAANPTPEDFNENFQFGLINEQGEVYTEFANRYKELNQWWLTRLQTSNHKGLATLGAPTIRTGMNTGSIQRIEPIKNTWEWSIWFTEAFIKQDCYTLGKSFELVVNVIKQLVDSEASWNRTARDYWGPHICGY